MTSLLIRFTGLSVFLTISLGFLGGCGSSTHLNQRGDSSNESSSGASAQASTASLPFRAFLSQSDTNLSQCLSRAREALFAPAAEGQTAREIADECEIQHDQFITALTQRLNTGSLSAEDRRNANAVKWTYDAQLGALAIEAQDLHQDLSFEPHNLIFTGNTRPVTAESILIEAEAVDADVTSCMNSARQMLPTAPMEPSHERIVANIRISGLVDRCNDMHENFFTSAQSLTGSDTASVTAISRRAEVTRHYQSLLTALFNDANELNINIGIEPVTILMPTTTAAASAQ